MLTDFILFINFINALIYNGQQERMISNAISKGNSFAFDSSCFEKWTTLMGRWCIHLHESFTHSYILIQSCCCRVWQ